MRWIRHRGSVSAKQTDPDDEAVLYAIEARNGNKGTLVDAYGPYSEAVTSEMAEKLRYTPKN